MSGIEIDNEINIEKAWKQVDGGQLETMARQSKIYKAETKTRCSYRMGYLSKPVVKAKLLLAAKNLVGACNLATANDTWMVTVRRWEECVCYGCGGVVRVCVWGL